MHATHPKVQAARQLRNKLASFNGRFRAGAGTTPEPSTPTAGGKGGKGAAPTGAKGSKGAAGREGGASRTGPAGKVDDKRGDSNAKRPKTANGARASNAQPVRAVSTKRRVQYMRPGGKVIGVATKTYGTGPLTSKRSEPVATSASIHGASLHEHEYADKHGRHISVRGRQFLMAVEVKETALPEGARTAAGCVVVKPNSFGGRLNLLSQEYEQHKVISLTLHYEPVVPTTTPGAIALYFRNDIATAGTDVGLDELTHASTHPSFVQTNVWARASLDITPSDVNVRYFDQDDGDPRAAMQGLITCLSASALPVGMYGNVYLDYTIDFFGEELDYEVEDAGDTDAILQYNAAELNGQNVKFEFNDLGTPPPLGACIMSLSNPPPSRHYMLYGTVTKITGPAPVWNSLEAGAVTVAVGQEYYLGVLPELMNSAAAMEGSYDDGTLDCVVCTDPTSILTADMENMNGVLVWSNANAYPITGSIKFRLRCMPLSTE